ncbi:hypothetical protein ACEXQD_00165 [Herbiconiux sp. P15]|uniref:MmyB family transcriptional regulator n=1 Tax=Herbiconiux liukaitaii TaxID=3342799 RepID=UPI0035B8682D
MAEGAVPEDGGPVDDGPGDIAARERLRALVDAWPGVPAFVHDRHLTVVVSNAIARALTPNFREGMNLARSTFLDPEVARTQPDWQALAGQVAGSLRESLDENDADDAFRSIVGELSAHSRSFSEAWADESGPAEPTGSCLFPHRVVGDMHLAFHRLRPPGQTDDTVVVWRPVDDASARSLAMLAELVTGGSEA